MMGKNFRYILAGLGVIFTGLMLWYFKHIVAYILIASVLSLVGRPLINIIRRLKVKDYRIPAAIAAFFTLACIWLLFYSFFRIFVPLLIHEANELSKIDPQQIINSLEEPIKKLENTLQAIGLTDSSFSIESYMTNKLASVFDISIISDLFSSLAAILGNIFIAIFAISFITFFFLKEDKLFNHGILAFVPDKYVESASKVLASARKLLMRYFIGIGGQITGIITLVTIGLSIVGIEFSRSLVIGLIAGLMNVIPYLGPVLGASIGILMGASTHLHLDFYSGLLPLLGLMALVFLIVQTIDNALFQPLIFSSSVKAHPLEIFLVIMMAGSLAGVPGMILAIPSYTVARVFAKEFLNKFKIVKKLTRNIG